MRSVAERRALGQLADAQILRFFGWNTEFQRLHAAAFVVAIAEWLEKCE